MGLTALLLGGFFMIMFMIAIAILSIVAVIWAIIDIVQAKNEAMWKVLWVVVSLFLGIIGVAIYYFVGRKSRKQ